MCRGGGGRKWEIFLLERESNSYLLHSVASVLTIIPAYDVWVLIHMPKLILYFCTSDICKVGHLKKRFIWVKPRTWKSYTCLYLAWCSGLSGKDKGWLAQYEDILTEWDIGVWCRRPGFPMGRAIMCTVTPWCHFLIWSELLLEC